MLEALHDGKGPLVLMILHHEPRDRLAVFAVDSAGFEELVVQFEDGFGGVLSVKVHYDCVDHVLISGFFSAKFVAVVKLLL